MAKRDGSRGKAVRQALRYDRVSDSEQQVAQQVAPSGVAATETQAALLSSAQEKFGNEIVLRSLSGALDGPGEMLEGAMTLGAAGVQLAPSLDGLLANSAVNGWIAEHGAGSDLGGPAIERHAQEHAEEESPDASRDVDRALSRGGHAIPGSVRQDLEARFGGVDFSGVRIHTDSAAASASDAISAHAFAVGDDIYFGRGEFQPSSPGGMHLLAHELSHVVQGGHVARAREIAGGLSVSSMTDAAEKEAEAVARDVVHTTQAAIGRGSGNIRRLVQRTAGPVRAVERLAGNINADAITTQMEKRLGQADQSDPSLEPKSPGSTVAGLRPLMDLAMKGNLNEITGFQELKQGGHDGAVDIRLGGFAKGDLQVQRDGEGHVLGGQGFLTVDHPLFGNIDPVLDMKVDTFGKVSGAGAVAGADLLLGGVRANGAIQLHVGSNQKLGASGQLDLDLGPAFQGRLVPDPSADVFGLLGDIGLSGLGGATSGEKWKVRTTGLALTVDGTVHGDIAGKAAALTATMSGGQLKVKGTVDGGGSPVDVEMDNRGRIRTTGASKAIKSAATNAVKSVAAKPLAAANQAVGKVKGAAAGATQQVEGALQSAEAIAGSAQSMVGSAQTTVTSIGSNARSIGQAAAGITGKGSVKDKVAAVKSTAAGAKNAASSVKGNVKSLESAAKSIFKR